MSYDIRYDSALAIVELVITSVLSGTDLKKCTDEVILVQKENGARAVLVDARDLESDLSLDDVLELPHRYEKNGARRSARLALVSPKLPKAPVATHFYERFCNNRGWTVQSFKARGEAVAWLTSEKTS